MVNKQLVRLYAVLVGGLAVLGIFVSGHLFNIMNVDPFLDVLRIGLVALLVYAGFINKSERLINASLGFVGLLYIGMGLLGLVDSTLFGLLPSGLTGFDIFFHLATGLLAAGAALQPNSLKTFSHRS